MESVTVTSWVFCGRVCCLLDDETKTNFQIGRKQKCVKLIIHTGLQEVIGRLEFDEVDIM